jgi:hypothetical protein
MAKRWHRGSDLLERFEDRKPFWNLLWLAVDGNAEHLSPPKHFIVLYDRSLGSCKSSSSHALFKKIDHKPPEMRLLPCYRTWRRPFARRCAM